MLVGQVTINNQIHRLGELDKFYYPDKTGHCIVCKRGEVETVNHFMFECIGYDKLRKNTLYTVSSDRCINKFISRLRNDLDVRQVINYVKKAVVLRESF